MVRTISPPASARAHPPVLTWVHARSRATTTFDASPRPAGLRVGYRLASVPFQGARVAIRRVLNEPSCKSGAPSE